MVGAIMPIYGSEATTTTTTTVAPTTTTTVAPTTTTTAAPIVYRKCTSFDVSIGCFSTDCCVINGCGNGAVCPSPTCSAEGWCL